MVEIRQWAEIKNKYQGGALLLGNGASVAVHSDFSYASLHKAAEARGHISTTVAGVFSAFGTDDFELVLRRLWQASLVNQTLSVEPGGKVDLAYHQVRDALIATVRDVHVPYESASRHFEAIYTFMQEFKTVLSLNYDLIVYWAMMASRLTLDTWFKDCFQQGGAFREDWEALRKPYGSATGATLVFYPHGNLITARLDDYTERKLSTAGGDANNLLERIIERWKDGSAVPLFVCEGTSDHKKQAIGSSAYLTQVFRDVMPNIGPSLVIYGWKISNQDQHILQQINRAKKVVRIAVSVFQENQMEAQRAEATLAALGEWEVEFFDAESPGCWIHPKVEVA